MADEPQRPTARMIRRGRSRGRSSSGSCGCGSIRPRALPGDDAMHLRCLHDVLEDPSPVADVEELWEAKTTASSTTFMPRQWRWGTVKGKTGGQLQALPPLTHSSTFARRRISILSLERTQKRKPNLDQRCRHIWCSLRDEFIGCSSQRIQMKLTPSFTIGCP